MIDFLTKGFYGNTIKEWLIALSIIFGSFILGKILYLISTKFLRKLTSKTKTELDDHLIDRLEKPIIFAIIIIGVWIGLKTLNLHPDIESWFSKSYIILIAFNISWVMTRTVETVMDLYILPLTERSKTDFDNQIYPIVKKSVIYIIWAIGIIVGLNNAGYNVGAILASLGIGGLAMAMAAKDTVSNFFGGITIFTDKPFKVGDRIKIAGFDGTVTELGIRSFHLKTLQGTVVTIPNSKVTDSCVENVSLEESRKITLNLGLTYQTEPEKIKLAMDLLGQIAIEHTSVHDKYLISFNSFGDSSLGILFIYYIKKGEDILGTQSEMNLKILTLFNQNRLDFAYPTQTLFIEKN